MLDYLIKNKWHTASIIAGLTIFIYLINHWSMANAANPRKDLLNGDYSNAFEKYQRTAEKGHAISQNSLGNMYYMGLGTKRDYKKAYSWYERAAINGSKPAYVNLGILYFRGQGVERDLLKAFAWFRLGEKAGIKSAETHMKYLAGINLITPNMIQKAKELYSDVASLTKRDDTGLHSFESQPHLGPTENDLRIQ